MATEDSQSVEVKNTFLHFSRGDPADSVAGRVRSDNIHDRKKDTTRFAPDPLERDLPTVLERGRSTSPEARQETAPIQDGDEEDGLLVRSGEQHVGSAGHADIASRLVVPSGTRVVNTFLEVENESEHIDEDGPLMRSQTDTTHYRKPCHRLPGLNAQPVSEQDVEPLPDSKATRKDDEEVASEDPPNRSESNLCRLKTNDSWDSKGTRKDDEQVTSEDTPNRSESNLCRLNTDYTWKSFVGGGSPIDVKPTLTDGQAGIVPADDDDDEPLVRADAFDPLKPQITISSEPKKVEPDAASEDPTKEIAVEPDKQLSSAVNLEGCIDPPRDLFGYPVPPWPWHPMPMGLPPSPDYMPHPSPPWGWQHYFHQECATMGQVDARPDARYRWFTKVGYEGRLSLVTEAAVHKESDGVLKYLVQFYAGQLSPADGVGFIFSSRLPCAKNIQKIVSIFANAHGRICMRVYDDIIKVDKVSIKPLEIGDWVELVMDLKNKVATFNIWPAMWPHVCANQPASTAEVRYGERLGRRKDDPNKPVNLSTGHLACCVKNQGVTLTLGS